MAQERPGRRDDKREGPFARVSAVATVIGLAIAYLGLAAAVHWVPFTANGTAVAVSAPKTSSSPSVNQLSPDSSPSSPAGTSPPAVAATPGAGVALPPPVTYLSSLPEPGGATTGPIWINGKSYPNSVFFDGLALDTKQETFDYDLSSGNYHTFAATVALISNGGQRDPQASVLFQVKVNGRTVASASCTRYASHSIKVSISGVSQLTLSMQLIRWTDPNSEVFMTDATPAWGDARVY